MIKQEKLISPCLSHRGGLLHIEYVMTNGRSRTSHYFCHFGQFTQLSARLSLQRHHTQKVQVVTKVSSMQQKSRSANGDDLFVRQEFHIPSSRRIVCFWRPHHTGLRSQESVPDSTQLRRNVIDTCSTFRCPATSIIDKLNE